MGVAFLILPFDTGLRAIISNLKGPFQLGSICN